MQKISLILFAFVLFNANTYSTGIFLLIKVNLHSLFTIKNTFLLLVFAGCRLFRQTGRRWNFFFNLFLNLILNKILKN